MNKIIKDFLKNFGFVHIDELNFQKNQQRIQEIKNRIEYLEEVRYFNDLPCSDYETDEEMRERAGWWLETTKEIKELQTELNSLLNE